MKKAWIILAALIAGLLIGMAVGDRSPLFHDIADVVGTIWLNGLRMTVIPLVVALLITGIVQTANAASAGRTATRSVITMISILVLV
ncbi:MAG TPA: cation:dicarboxylase symporter family transporter, partial [Sphingorhabdus sp.]|nr:cation:dicarboxylase symporter family transporter [Sphingorhabdus sp.]